MMNSLNIYAAGSLRYAFPLLADTFTQHYQTTINLQFSPAGLLCDKIRQEAEQPIAHLFASANTYYPEQLVQNGLAKSQQIFTCNRLCMMLRHQACDQSLDWLAILLNPQTRIGMSTPKKDPSGDYTFALFDEIDRQQPGQGELLKQRAMQLVGGELSSSLPTNVHPAEYFLLNERVDVFIGYASYINCLGQHPPLTMLDIPPQFYPEINYSIALLNNIHPDAACFVDFLQSRQAQAILVNKGFIAI